MVILGTFVIGVAVPESAMDIAIAVMLALAAALVIWQVRAGGRRFMKREVVPVLAQTLAPGSQKHRSSAATARTLILGRLTYWATRT